MSDKLDEIISLGQQWEEGLSELISDLKNEIRNSNDKDFKKILESLEETSELLSYFKLATRDDVLLARVLKGSPVIMAGEIFPSSYGQSSTLSVSDIESRLSQVEKELEEMKEKVEKMEENTDTPKKKSEHLSKGIQYAKDLFILIEKVKDYIGS